MDVEGMKAEIKALKEQVTALCKSVKHLQAPDHSTVFKIGGLMFTCQDEIHEFLMELEEKEPLPPSFGVWLTTFGTL